MMIVDVHDFPLFHDAVNIPVFVNVYQLPVSALGNRLPHPSPVTRTKARPLYHIAITPERLRGDTFNTKS